MQLRKPFSIILLLTAACVMAAGIFSPTLKKLFISTQDGDPHTQEIVVLVKDSYEKLWKRVDSCTNKGLTKSALQVVDEIYAKAKEENNAPHKCLVVVVRLPPAV